MHQIYITRVGTPKVLQVREAPNPLPREGEVAIAVRAAGVNYADIMTRKGLNLDAPKPPCVVGYEVAGEIVALGEGVKKIALGEHVLTLTRYGGYSDYVCVPAHQVFIKPKALSFEQAAAVPVNYLAAYQLLVVMGSLHAHDSVLIHNAGGGVGLAALDIAQHIGAKTFGTASASKHAFLRERGLDFAIDYRTQDWLKAVLELTHGRGVELVIDPIGGAQWKKSFKALRPSGRLGFSGVTPGGDTILASKLGMIKLLLQMPWFNPVQLLNSNKGVFGINMGRLWEEEEKVLAWLEKILEGVEAGWVRPHVDRAFKFDQASAAHAYLDERKNIGKVVLVPGEIARQL